nr:HEPN domain-containing protein [Methylocystis echinoides]
MKKAKRALSAARLLLTAGDGDGACNRAYYAMFDAAHAALFALAIEKFDARPSRRTMA